jgi:Protein of unknown function (DUF2726)
MSIFLWLPLLVLGAVVLVVLFNRLRSRQGEGSGGSADFDRLDTLAAWPPQATRILTTHERLAYSTLLRAFPDYMVLAQVPLSRFLKVPTRHSHAEWLRRVGNMCADLLVCDMASQVVAVVIVQPAGGLTSERAAARRDRMTRVLKSVGIRLLVWVENALPSPDAAREAILPAPAPAIAPSAPDVQTAPASAGSSTPTQPAQDEAGAEPPPTWYDDLDSRPTPLRPLAGPGTPKR